MRMRYPSGLTIEAIILAVGGERMRIVAANHRDTAELHSINGCWYTEANEPIEIDSIIQIPGVDVSDSCAAIYPLTYSAGSNNMPV